MRHREEVFSAVSALVFPIYFFVLPIHSTRLLRLLLFSFSS